MSLASSLLASFVGKDYTNFKRVSARTPRISYGCYTLVLLAKGHSSTFYSHKRHYWRTTRDATVVAFTDAFKDVIMHILHIVKSHVSIQ